MSGAVGFCDLLAALRDSFTGAREATCPGSLRRAPRIAELTLSLEGTLYESASGLSLRVGRQWLRRRRALQRVEIRLHGHEPIVTEISINGERL